MSERVNCNILQPSTLARRSSVVTAQDRASRDSRKTGKNRRRAAKTKDAPFAVNVNRKWNSAKNTVRSILDMYKWLDEIPLGLFIDAWA